MTTYNQLPLPVAADEFAMKQPGKNFCRLFSDLESVVPKRRLNDLDHRADPDLLRQEGVEVGEHHDLRRNYGKELKYKVLPDVSTSQGGCGLQHH